MHTGAANDTPPLAESLADGSSASMSPADRHSVEHEVTSFVRQIEGLSVSYDLTNLLLWGSARLASQEHLKFLEANASLIKEAPTKKYFNLPPHFIYEASLLKRKHEQTVAARRIVPKSFLVALVSQFDVLVG